MNVDNRQYTIPEELAEAIAAIDSEVRQTIIKLLQAKGELSYTQLQQSTKLGKGSLTYHLSELMKAGLVKNYGKTVIGDPFDSFYSSTHLADRLFDALDSVLTTPSRIQVENASTSREAEAQYKRALEFKEIVPEGDQFSCPRCGLITRVSGVAQRPKMAKSIAVSESLATHHVKKIWIAIATPSAADFFAPLIKILENEYQLLVTAVDNKNIHSILKAHSIKAKQINFVRGGGLPDKLQAYAQTIEELIPIVRSEKPGLLLTERWPEAVRIAFGFDVPAWTIFYDERERHVNQMVFPLSSKVFASKAYTPEALHRNGVTQPEKIVWFTGTLSAARMVHEIREFNVHHEPEVLPSGEAPELGLEYEVKLSEWARVHR
jgi:DNA-binding transcriptional ArsR family regulator